MSGFFLTFEGIDGVGKTTQVHLLTERLRQCGYSVVSTHEPGGTKRGKQIRELLKQGTVDDYAELFLLMADRAEHVTKVIQPHLEQGYIVISDRYCDSTFAYQGYGKDIDRTHIAQLNALACKGIYPDCTIIIDLDLRLAAERITARNNDIDPYDHAALSLRRKIQLGYHVLFYSPPSAYDTHYRMLYNGNQEKPHRRTRVSAVSIGSEKRKSERPFSFMDERPN